MAETLVHSYGPDEQGTGSGYRSGIPEAWFAYLRLSLGSSISISLAQLDSCLHRDGGPCVLTA